MLFHQCAFIVLFGFTLFDEHAASQQRTERIFGSSSGSSVIVVYKKDHDKDNAADRGLGGTGGGTRGGTRGATEGGTGGGTGVSIGEEQAGRAGAAFRSRDQRDPRDYDGRKVDIELRQEHGIKIFPADDESDIKQHDSAREPSSDDHRTTSHHNKSRSRVEVDVTATSQGHDRRNSRRPPPLGHRDDRRDFDDSSSSIDDDYRFTKAKDSFPAVRRPPTFSPAADVRPACARELDLCSHNHDYPLEKVQTIVDRYYNQMYDLYHAMYKIPPHEVQWVENFTHSFSQEKQHGEFVCRSEVSYLRIGWAKNYKGHWMTVVNTERFPQMSRVEKCRYRDKPCEFMATCFKTSCKQREMLLPLIAVNPHDPSQKPQVDLFPIPSGCVCYVDDPFFHGRTRKDDSADYSSSYSKLPAFFR